MGIGPKPKTAIGFNSNRASSGEGFPDTRGKENPDEKKKREKIFMQWWAAASQIMLSRTHTA